jgi:hypothetical protein
MISNYLQIFFILLPDRYVKCWIDHIDIKPVEAVRTAIEVVDLASDGLFQVEAAVYPTKIY